MRETDSVRCCIFERLRCTTLRSHFFRLLFALGTAQRPGFRCFGVAGGPENKVPIHETKAPSRSYSTITSTSSSRISDCCWLVQCKKITSLATRSPDYPKTTITVSQFSIQQDDETREEWLRRLFPTILETWEALFRAFTEENTISPSVSCQKFSNFRDFKLADGENMYVSTGRVSASKLGCDRVRRAVRRWAKGARETAGGGKLYPLF